MTHSFEKVVGVLGGGGFLGRYVVNALYHKEMLVKVGGRHPERYGHLKVGSFPGHIQLYKVDLRREASVKDFIDGCDVVVNLVGLLFERGTQRFDVVHTEAAKMVANVCAAQGVKHLIHVSALGAHEKSGSHYARTKALAETHIQRSFPTATILRPSLIFGPEDNFFNRFANIIRLFPIAPLFKDGATRFQPVYVGDVARAIATCVQTVAGNRQDDAIPVQGKQFELGGPDIFTFQELLEKIMDIMDQPRPFLHLPDVVGYGLSLVSKVMTRPILTIDQIKLLSTDAICTGEYPGFSDLNINPKSLDEVLPAYLGRFMRHKT